MSENIRSTNLRFNLDKDVQNRAWQYLQTMDKKKFKSYSQIIAISLVDYFDRYYKKQDEPYLETREREERFVEQIVTAVENAMNRTLPVYLACIGSVSDIAENTVICYQIAHLEIIKCQIFTESITFAEGCVQKGKSLFAFRLKEAFSIISVIVNDFSTEGTDQAGNRRVQILIAFQQQWDGGLSVVSSQLSDFFKSF